MKKLMLTMFALVLAFGLAQSAYADRYVYSTSITGVTATASTNLPISGYIDKIELSQSAGRTCTVIVASYDANGTAIDTLMSTGSTSSDTLVVRPRAVGTTTAGVALTADSTTVATYSSSMSQLQIPYERILGAGNICVRLTGGDEAASSTNVVSVGIVYEPLKK